MFLVTGTGCSGTGWMSKFFTELGFECGHEKWFKAPEPEMMQGSESSWLAVPFLEQIPRSTKIIRVVRHPLAVVKSAYASGFLSNEADSDHAQFIRMRRPAINIDTADHFECVLNWVVHWDWPIFRNSKFHLHRIEDMKANNLFSLVRYATGQTLNTKDILEVAKNIPTNINTHRNTNKDLDFITWEFVRKYTNGFQLVDRALNLGYSIHDE